MNKIDKLFMYITSMLPIGIVIVITYIYEVCIKKLNEGLSYSYKTILIVSFIMIISSIYVTLRIFLFTKFNVSSPYVCKATFINPHKEKSTTMEYLLTFTLPILALGNIIAIIVYMLIIGLLYIKYDLSKYNFLLECLGYTLYKVEYRNELVFLYSKQKLIFDEINCIFLPVSSDVFILISTN